MIITLQKRNTLELPRELRQALKLEPGASLEVHVEKGRLVLTPVALGPPTLRLSKTGEAKEAEADAEIRQGRTCRFENVEELIEDLDG